MRLTFTVTLSMILWFKLVEVYAMQTQSQSNRDREDLRMRTGTTTSQ
jgi:hypothetical protein